MLIFNNCNVHVLSRKEWLPRINQYWRSFCTTHEHYNYLQLIKQIKMVSIQDRYLRMASIIKCGLEESC